MATNLTTTEKPTRRDVFGLAPDDVTLGRNARIGAEENPEYPEKVKKLAVSIAQHGQLEPAVGHRDPETKKVILDAGATRLAAVRLLRQGFSAVDPTDGETRTFHDPNVKLDVVVETKKVTDKEAFLRSYIENVTRDDLNPLEEAEAQAVLREEFKMTDAEIARLGGETNQNRVMALKKLINAQDYVREMVRDGKLGLYVYSENLFGLSPENVAGAIKFATDDQGKVSGSKVRQWLRDVLSGSEPPKPESAETEPTEKKSSVGQAERGPRVPKRTVKELLTFCDNYCSDENGDRNEKAAHVLHTLARWMRVELKTEKQLLAALDEIK